MKKYKNIVEFINNCEKIFSDQLDSIVCEIIKKGHLKIIALTGPTCSGKTTAANMLINRLNSFGMKCHLISIDDFFHNREYLLRISHEKGLKTPDYDSINAIDFDALKEFINEIFESREAHCPVFDFCDGVRKGYKAISAKEDDVFIFEGIQSIYPEISSILMQKESVSIFISPESSINIGAKVFEPNEIRLMRRIVRDYNFRGTSPDITLKMWEGVRANEESNIFPYIDGCDYRIDSTMPYEIGVLAPYLKKILCNIAADSCYKAKALEILDKVSEIMPISDKYISLESLYKEFV